MNWFQDLVYASVLYTVLYITLSYNLPECVQRCFRNPPPLQLKFNLFRFFFALLIINLIIYCLLPQVLFVTSFFL